MESITSDSTQLGSDIRVVDDAVKSVEDASSQMLEKMKNVCEVMQTMTGCIGQADEINHVMLSKYEESANNVNIIESVVSKLMVELGSGGFMGVQDVEPGMKISLYAQDTLSGRSYDCKGEVQGREDNVLTFALQEESGKDIPFEKESMSYKLRIVVDNVLYNWDDIRPQKAEGKLAYCVRIDANPQIINRRKHPRMPLKDACEIILTDEPEKKYRGRMTNVSANGFAFCVRDEFFAQAKGKKISVRIPGFEVLKGKALEGVIIRSSDNEGEYIVGCRMFEDSAVIKEYVSKNYAE